MIALSDLVICFMIPHNVHNLKLSLNHSIHAKPQDHNRQKATNNTSFDAKLTD